jgi:hypothetical protein
MPLISCPQCGHANAPALPYCGNCGTPFGAAPAAPVPPAAGAVGWASLLFPGRVRVRGRVINVQSFRMPPPFRWRNALAVAALVAFLVFVVLPVVLPELLRAAAHLLCPLLLAFVILSALSNMAGGMLGGRSFQPGALVSQIVSPMCRGLFHMGRFPYAGHYQRPPDLTVHDVTLLDHASGRQVLVRIEGDFANGTVATGQEIEVEGADRNGTIFFCRGVNLSLGLDPAGTEIRVTRSRWAAWS